MTKKDVLCVMKLLPDQMAELERTYTLHRYDLAEDKDALLREVGERIEAVATTGGVGFDAALADRLPNLGIVASSGVGYDKIDVAACTANGIKVTNTPDVLNDDVADCALMLMLATRRALVWGDGYVRSGDWGRKGPMPLQQASAGKLMGIVGLGRIGQAIARRAEALGMTVAYTGRSEKPVPYEFVPDQVELARRADVLMISVAGGAGTVGLVDRATLEAVGPEGTLVNISRGTVVDEAAMIELLKSGGIGRAGLDVFNDEPTPDPAFAELPNVTLYPHGGSATGETRAAMSQLAVDNIHAHFAGKALLTPVN